MNMFFKGAAVALALAGASLATTANADDYGRDRAGANVTLGFGNIAFAYRDGYWDNDHRWHRWHSRRDYRSYRHDHGDNYHDWNHDRDDDNGWQRR